MGGLMKSVNPQAIKDGFALIEPHLEHCSAYFYGRLFAENPRLRALFPPAMNLQRERLFRALTEIVWSIDNPDALTRFLARLGRDHRKFGVHAQHYETMGRALLATLRRFAGDAWTGEMESAWATGYRAAAQIMIAAAEEDAGHRPPWWIGEVVEHERRTPDIAVLGVRPDQPLPYRAGQYTTVQCARWPRVWRPYSFAGAPRDDGLLRFHVRAMPGGWVSGALVRHTRIGDTLLLGHAMGTMTLDTGSGRDMLCVAGGTGLAPIKALVEEAVRSGERRDIHLLFGARTSADLYDLPELEALQAAYPWLRVVPIVSDDPSFDGMHGPVSDVLDRFPDWSAHDVYVAGPMEMVRRTVKNLQDLGVPAARIHHDPLE